MVAKWHQTKLNSALKKACMLGSYKMAILIIRAGANNFEQCIRECTRQNRLNHILAYLRLCQAAYEDDQTAVDILLESDEDKISEHPRYPSLVDFNTILLPLIENGTLTITEPLHIALRANHRSMAGKILARSSKRHTMGMVDWHDLELSELDPGWLRPHDFLSMHLLCLSFNALKQIPSQVCEFASLVKLQVAYNQLTYVPSGLFQIPCIENIDLSYNSISALPEALLGKVSDSLRILTLAHNRLAVFPGYFVDSSLRALDLSKNRFGEVPESVYSIRQLESLNMSHNPEIQFIPYELGGLKHLRVTSFDGLPYTLNVPNDSLMEFVKRRFKSMQTVSHHEVVLIGSPHHAHLVEGVAQAFSASSMDCGLLRFESPAQFLHLHHVFKLPNAVYVLLWDCQNRQEPDDLHHTLRHLSLHAPESLTIVAACWEDAFDATLEQELEEIINNSLWGDLREAVQLEHLVLTTLASTAEDEGDKVQPYSFRALLLSVSKLSESVRLTQFVPGSYYACGQALTRRHAEYEREVRCPMLSEDDFWELVSGLPSHDLASREELVKLVSYLRLAGLVVHVPGPTGSQSHYIFNRQWFCDILGNILSRRGTQLVQSFSGIVHQEVLIDLLACPSLQQPLPNALKHMLNKEAVAMALSSEKWLIPSMLSPSPEHTTNIQPDQYSIRRQYTLVLTPPTFWCRLIAHLLMNMDSFVREVSEEGGRGGGIVSPASSRRHYSTLPRQGGVTDWTYWKNGILCWKDARHLVYSVEFVSTCRRPYQETIEIRVPNSLMGYRAMQRLSLVVDTLLKNWFPEVWGSVEIWVPCSYCIHTGVPKVPSVSFEDCLLAVSKGVGVRCVQHPEKVTSIARIIPDLVQEDMSKDVFLPPGSVEFDTSDKSSCLSQPPLETVFKGTYNHQLVAVKPFLKPQAINEKRSEEKAGSAAMPPLLRMWMEFEILRHLQAAKCKFIVEVTGVCPDPLCLVFPFARWSSLDDLFHSKDVIISHVVRMKMVYQLASALSVLQSYRVIHRNVCLANLLVFSLSAADPVNIKLSGFSSACYSIFQGIGVGEFGSFPAPEMLLGTEGEYDERVDIFALAFVAYQIVIQGRMHVTSSVPLQRQCVDASRPSLEPIRVRAPYLVPLISKCWHPDRTKRPFASKVVQMLKQPLHVLVRDGHLVHKQHEFFAASARFTRLQNHFHSDLFVCSGQLMGSQPSFLARESLPGLSFESFKQLPTEFVICMGCIGCHLWVSFYGKKVRVYSALSMECVHEFTFNYHVCAIAVSPTSVYLGLETGVLQVYEVSESVPSEPSLTKIVNPGEEFKCIEAVDDNVVCATRSTIFCLHPDTLDIEERWDMDPKKEIRGVAISRCFREKEEDEREGNDLMWVAFRRWDRVLVMNPWTGQGYYSIDVPSVLDKPATKVYVQSLRVVLDTVWIGTNTGHVLIFSSNHEQPRLLTHLKVHREGVRQLLLLHPSYTGPSTVLSSSEISQRLRNNPSPTAATAAATTDHGPRLPESVLVVSFGTGLEYPVCSVDKHGVMVEEREDDSEVNRDGLFAVILEGSSISQMVQVERNSDRPPLPYMEGYEEEEDDLYTLPPDGIVHYDSPQKLIPSNIPRINTWSVTGPGAVSPVASRLKQGVNDNVYDTIPQRRQEDQDLSMSKSDVHPSLAPAPKGPPPPPLPPRIVVAPASSSANSGTMSSGPGVKSPLSPLGSVLNSLYKTGKESVKTEATPTSNEGTGGEEDEGDEYVYEGIYSYPYQDPQKLRAQSYTLPFPSKSPSTSLQTRRLTYDDHSRPDIEDSAEDLDPYVMMDSLQAQNLRLTASRANKRAKARMLQGQPLSEVPEEDFMSREEFLGNRVEEALKLDKPEKRPKPKVAPKPFIRR